MLIELHKCYNHNHNLHSKILTIQKHGSNILYFIAVQKKSLKITKAALEAGGDPLILTPVCIITRYSQSSRALPCATVTAAFRRAAFRGAVRSTFWSAHSGVPSGAQPPTRPLQGASKVLHEAPS